MLYINFHSFVHSNKFKVIYIYIYIYIINAVKLQVHLDTMKLNEQAKHKLGIVCVAHMYKLILPTPNFKKQHKSS